MEFARIDVTISGRDSAGEVDSTHRTAQESLMMMFLNTQVKPEKNRLRRKLVGPENCPDVCRGSRSTRQPSSVAS